MVDWKAWPNITGCSYWVFDDFPPERIKSSYKQFMGNQKEFTVTDKYLKKSTIANIGPAIYLFNTPDFNNLNLHLDMGWVYDNCTVINIENKLY